jgi:hypothetical protein
MKRLLVAAALVVGGIATPPSTSPEAQGVPVEGGATFVCYHGLPYAFYLASLLHVSPDWFLDLLFREPKCWM